MPKHWDMREKSGFLFLPKTCVKKDTNNFTTTMETRWLVWAKWSEIYSDFFESWENGVWLD